MMNYNLYDIIQNKFSLKDDYNIYIVQGEITLLYNY